MVGERLFEVESGIIAGWYAQCVEDYPTELFPYHCDVVGQPPARVVYGKGSGLPSVALALAALGISAEDEEMREVLAAIKARALETKALLPFEEVVRIVQERLGARAALGAPAA